MKMLKNWKIKENIIKVLKTYPIVLCCFFAIGTLGIISVHSHNDITDTIAKINLSIAIFAGFALVLRSIKIKYDKLSIPVHILLLIICLGLSFGYYFTINLDNDWTIIRTMIILFIQGLLFISLPFVKDDEHAEHFVNLAAGRLIISGILFGIAYGGVAGILFALEELFGLKITYKAYSDAAIILATTFLPMLWLFGLDYNVKPSTTKLYKVLLSYVCIPLLFVYSAVVYGFIIKIVADGFVMPSSIIGNLVLWYSFVSIVVTYLARPYEDNSLTKFFYKWYPIISVLPIVIMFIAMFMRINQYALTVNRYYLLLGGIWLALMFGYLIFVRFAKKKRTNIVITLSIALFAIISIFEPISANAIAEKSQINRLESIVTKYIDGDTIDVKSMPEDEIEQAQDILNYLNWNHYGYDFWDSRNNYHKNFDKKIDFLSIQQAKKIGIVNIEHDIYNYKTYVNANKYYDIIPPIDLEGYKYLININNYDFRKPEELYSFNEYELSIEKIFDEDGHVVNFIIFISKNQEIIEELSLVECYQNKMIAKSDDFGSDYSDFIYETDDKTIKIILNTVEFSYDESIKINQFEGYLLVK